MNEKQFEWREYEPGDIDEALNYFSYDVAEHVDLLVEFLATQGLLEDATRYIVKHVKQYSDRDGLKEEIETLKNKWGVD